MKDVSKNLSDAGAYIEQLRAENQALRDTLESVATLAKIPKKGYVVPVHVVPGKRNVAAKASRRPRGARKGAEAGQDTQNAAEARPGRQAKGLRGPKPVDLEAAAKLLPGQTVRYIQGRGSFEATIGAVDVKTGLVRLTRAKDGKAVERLASKLSAV